MDKRKKDILRLLSQNEGVTVAELAKEFKVSGVTIRQDLRNLEEEGLVRRVHGGATLVNQADIEYRIGKNYEVKLAIARRASGCVQPYETIFIESGSANALLAQEISRDPRGITVITSSVYIARMLRGSKVKTILLGGVYQHESECLVGQTAKIGLAQLNFEKAFIGVDGFTVDSGFTSADMMRAEIASQAIAQAQKSYIVTDSTKFGKVSLVKICDIDKLDYLITDSTIDEVTLQFMESNNVEVYFETTVSS